MRIFIDDVYSLRAINPKQPGEEMLIALENQGWVEVEGVRKHVPQTMAIYSNAVLLLRDLASDATGRLVLRGEIDTLAAFVSETQRLAELTQVALKKLKKQQADHV